MEDIMRLATSEAMLFKYGSGTGTDLSTLRSTREKLSGGGRPSGPLSFLKVYDQVANVVKSGGKTRRAAKMNTLKDWHPDIEEFIDAKTEGGEEGLGADRAGLRRLLQRRRLRLRDVPEREPLRARQRRVHARGGGGPRVVDPPRHRRRAVREEGRARAAAQDRRGHLDLRRSRHAVRRHHPEVAHLQGHRPAELHQPLLRVSLPQQHRLQPRLAEPDEVQASDGAFDVERFKAAVRIFITAQEILVDNASYPTKAIAENSHIFRTLGLGYANLGSLIMSYGCGYDSDEGRAWPAPSPPS